MQRKIHLNFLFIVLIPIISIWGCGNYAKFVYESSPGIPNRNVSKMTIDRLSKEWMNYHIAYSGLRPPLAKGIIFDLKDDDKVLILEGDLWKKVTDENTFQRLIFWTAGPEKYEARLFKIMGPANQFFGYIYYSNRNVSAAAKIIDENTLKVYHINDLIIPSEIFY